MGGYGSGFRGISKTTVEACLSIDATRWQREGILRPLCSGYDGRWFWLDPDTSKELASIRYESNCGETGGSIHLYYTSTCQQYKSRGLQRPPDHKQDALGKLRWWFICPLVVNERPCGRRVRKLYLPGGGRYFGCRHCYNLTYTSCQESHKYDSVFAHVGAQMGYQRRRQGSY